MLNEWNKVVSSFARALVFNLAGSVHVDTHFHMHSTHIDGAGRQVIGDGARRRFFSSF